MLEHTIIITAMCCRLAHHRAVQLKAACPDAHGGAASPLYILQIRVSAERHVTQPPGTEAPGDGRRALARRAGAHVRRSAGAHTQSSSGAALADYRVRGVVLTPLSRGVQAQYAFVPMSPYEA